MTNTLNEFLPEPPMRRRAMDSILRKSVESRAQKVDANGKPEAKAVDK